VIPTNFIPNKTSSTVPIVSTNYEKLQKCPSGLDLYSPHNLKPSAIKLIVTGLNTWPSKDQQDCKWDVLDTDHNVLTGVKAIFRNESRLAEIIGDISLDNKLYILEGADKKTQRMVYLSKMANNADDGKWKVLEKTSGQEIVIKITNDFFFNFFLSEGISWLYCNGERCGCDNKICEGMKNNLKIRKFGFNAKEKTFSLYVDKNFDYGQVYKFQMDLDVFFTSELTLRFHDTK